MLDTPRYVQAGDADCGPTVARMLASFWGVRAPRFSADPMQGFHPSEMEAALRGSGLWVFGGSMDVGDLRTQCRRGRPVACLIRTDAGGHWVAIRGVGPRYVHTQDPSAGRRRVSLEAWEGLWWDRDRTGTVFAQHGVVPWL